MTESLATVLERADRQRAEEAAKVRRLAAELAVLVEYDENRSYLGHDYGGAQRLKELNRRRTELGRLTRFGDAGVDPYRVTIRNVGVSELRDALERIAHPRMARLDRETYRRETPAGRRARQAWDRTVTAVDRVTGGPR